MFSEVTNIVAAVYIIDNKWSNTCLDDNTVSERIFFLFVCCFFVCFLFFLVFFFFFIHISIQGKFDQANKTNLSYAMSGLGRGRWAVSQKHTLILHFNVQRNKTL